MMQFFLLNRSIVGSHDETNFEQMPPVHLVDPLNCPECGEIATLLRSLPPYRVTLKAYGRELGDLAFGVGGNLLVSNRFRSAWEAENLRGLEFTPLERLRVRPARLGKKTPTYFHTVPQLHGTQVDVDRSLIEYDRPITCGKCKSGGLDNIRGVVIDESSWTGEDMFYPWGLYGCVVVTDRVRQLRDDHGLTNVNLTPVEEYFWDPLNKWTPVDYSRPDWATPDEDDHDPITDEPSDAN